MVEAFGKYLLLEKIASGGMAEVYLAKSIGANGINKFVAIKRILPQYSDNPEFIDMFKEEAKIAVNLNHGNVVSIFDFGVEKSQFFLVMEFVEGQNLRQILNHLKKESKDLTFDQITYIAKEVAAGLDHAHRCLDGSTGRPLNITHRDMSPQNVMISFEGEIKVVDFGIAKAENQVENTRVGTIKGKFGYMSPEQAEGQQVDLRTDIFSLGIVLWELLARDRLFAGPTEAATLRKVRECQVPSLRKINPSIPPELERICNKALAKDRTLRYQTSAAFHKDLNRFLNVQFPEFSAQEFSKAMKSLYNKMYVENRKKFAEYAQMQFEDRSDQSQGAFTQTETERSARSTVEVKEASSNTPATVRAPFVPTSSSDDDVRHKNLEDDAGKVDMGALKREKNSASKTGSTTKSTTRTRTSSRRGQTSSYTITKVGIPSRSPSPSMAALSFVALGLIAIVAFNEPDFFKGFMERFQKTEQTSTNPSSTPIPSATANPYVPVQITVRTEPPSASVVIDGQNRGFTPFKGWIEMNKPFQIVIRKDGFIPIEQDLRAINEEGITIIKTLQQEPPMGYISIDVVNGGADPIITVNNQKLIEKPPIGQIRVPANTPIKIRALNPFTNLYSEQTVSVDAGKKLNVRLILGRNSRK